MKGCVALALGNIWQQVSAGARRVKAPKFPEVWKYPQSVEDLYAKKIAGIVNNLFAIVREELILYPTWSADSGTLIVDGFAKDWDTAMQRMRRYQKELFEAGDGRDVFAMVSSVSESVSGFNFKEWSKRLSALAGHPYFPPAEEWVATTLDTWSDTNFELIRSLTDDGISKVNSAVTDAVMRGTSQADLTKMVRKLNTNLSGARARLIARDQVGKLNGALSKRRQQDAEVDDYTWKTAHDERVRSSHQNMQGKKCAWADASVLIVAGKKVPRAGSMPQSHPGFDIQCRCYASPDLEAAWAEAEQLAREEGWLPSDGVPPAPVAPVAPVAPGAPAVTTKTPKPPKPPAVVREMQMPQNVDAFVNAPEYLKRAVARAEERKVQVLTTSTEKGSHYKISVRGIYVEPKIKAYGKDYEDTVWRHEFGHHIDHSIPKANQRAATWSAKNFAADMEVPTNAPLSLYELSNIDVATQEIMAKKAAEHGFATVREAADFFYSKGIDRKIAVKLSNQLWLGDRHGFMRDIPHSFGKGIGTMEWGFLEDCIGSVTKGKYGGGHTAAYYAIRGKPETELFAQFTALIGGPSGKKWDGILRALFPDAHAKYIKAVTKYGEGV